MKKRMKKRLPVKYPPTNDWVWHSDLFAILTAYPQTNSWIYSNYIQLMSTVSYDTYNHNQFLFIEYWPFQESLIYAFCPWIKQQIFSRVFVHNHFQDMKEFFIDMIENNQYIYTIINERYILNRNYDYNHQIFIYGYDLEKQTFDVADFTFDDHYRFVSVPMDMVCKGYESVREEEDHLYLNRGGIVLLEFNHDVVYDFNMGLTKKYFIDYITRNNINMTLQTTIMEPDNKLSLGVDVYDDIFEHLRLLSKKQIQYDVRVPHVIQSHKIMMEHRIRYMQYNGYTTPDPSLLDDVKKIKEHATIVRNLYMKYHMIHDNVSSRKINALIDRYQQLQQMELHTYDKIIHSF